MCYRINKLGKHILTVIFISCCGPVRRHRAANPKIQNLSRIVGAVLDMAGYLESIILTKGARCKGVFGRVARACGNSAHLQVELACPEIDLRLRVRDIFAIRRSILREDCSWFAECTDIQQINRVTGAAR